MYFHPFLTIFPLVLSILYWTMVILCGGVLGKIRFELFSKGNIMLDKMRVDGRVKRLVELV